MSGANELSILIEICFEAGKIQYLSIGFSDRFQ